MLGPFCDGAAFRGYRVRLLTVRILVLVLPCTLALVRTMGVWGMGEVFIVIRKVIEEEGGRVVGEGNRRDKGRIANNFGNLRDRRRRKVAVARHDRGSV